MDANAAPAAPAPLPRAAARVPWEATAYTLCAVVMFVAMAVCIRALADRMPAGDIAFYRAAGCSQGSRAPRRAAGSRTRYPGAGRQWLLRVWRGPVSGAHSAADEDSSLWLRRVLLGSVATGVGTKTSEHTP